MRFLAARVLVPAAVIGLAVVCQHDLVAQARPHGEGYAALVTLFHEWREFQRPPLVDGVPDYRPGAMSEQRARLLDYQRQLNAINTAGWSVADLVDWHVVRAEMNGLEFDHRVLAPWANNPAFYVTVFGEQSDQPAREGPFAWGAVEVWALAFPLSAGDAAEVGRRIRAIPPLLDQARSNLVGNGRDLWVYSVRSLRDQAVELERLASRVKGTPGTLVADVQRARAATEEFAAWVEREAGRKTGRSGIGIDNYDWYLRNVQLVPYTWRDEVTLMERELARAWSFLALEERRNAELPEQVPVGSAEEHKRRFEAGITDYLAFLQKNDLLTMRDYMGPALRARVGSYSPGPRDFFTEVDYRDPEVMRTHSFHWFDLARMTELPNPDPIRRGPLLYNIFTSRTEGLATGWEEMMLQAGMFDARPRSRELIYVLLAQRAARALGDLRMHANEFTLDEAARFAAANTPRGWLRLDGGTVWAEQHLYLQQPAYGTSYVTGKIQIETLLKERRKQLGDRFTVRGFMDDLESAGLIPVSLIRWQLAGTPPPDVGRMLEGPR